MEITKAINLLVDTISTDKKHQDYDRVTKSADTWKQIITGEGIENLLKIFSPREDPELFKQRKTLTQVVTPAVTSALSNPQNKIARSRPLENSITDKEGKALDDVQKLVDNYWAERPLDYYLESAYLPHNNWDPNAFIITTFDDYDHRFQKPRPYSVIVNCYQAVNYEFANGDLQWLIVKSDPNSMGRFLLYTDTNVIDAVMVPMDSLSIEEKFFVASMKDGEWREISKDVYGYKKNNENIYKLTVKDPKTGEILAIRTGNILDKWTNGRTCLSPLHAAFNHLMKSIKVVSEMDLSISLHVFLQKFIYVPRCKGDGTNDCINGYTAAGALCSVCKGSKKIPMHTSSGDTVELPLPEEMTDLFDLSKMAYVLNLPIEIVEWLDKFCDKLETKCTKAIYGSEIFQTDTVATTATEKVIDYESILDALFPLSRQYDQVRIKIVRLSAKFLDHKDAIIKYKTAYDLKIKSFSQLLADLKAANESGASAEVREAISDEVTKQTFIDRPDEYKKLKIRDDYNPFSGKLRDEIIFVITSNLCTIEQKILWSQSPDIWNALEQADKNIYEKEPSKIKAALDAEVKKRVDLLEAQQITATSFPTDGAGAEGAQAGDSIGKLPLGAQQLALTLQRAKDTGNEELANLVEAKIKEIIDAIQVEA